MYYGVNIEVAPTGKFLFPSYCDKLAGLRPKLYTLSACNAAVVQTFLISGADPAIGGPGGRLPLRAWLLRIYCTKMHEIWYVHSRDNYYNCSH